MRYLIFCAQYWPQTFGVESHTMKLAKALSARGHRVTVAACKKGEWPARETVHGHDIIRVPSRWCMGGRMPLVLSLSALRHVHADRVIIQTPLYPLSLAGARFAARRRIPGILISHGADYVRVDPPCIRPLERLYERTNARRIAGGCTAAFGISSGAARHLAAMGIACGGVLPNMIDPAEIRAAAPSALIAPFEGLTVLYAGRLRKDKGIPTLLEAMDLLRGRGAHAVRLVVAGSGPLARSVSGREGVLYLGQRTPAEVLSLMKACDVFALVPEIPEGMPTALMEAAACGMCIVTSDRGGSRDVLAHGVTGVLLKEGSARALAGALADLAADAPHRKRLGTAARGHVLEHFSSDAVLARVEAAFVAGG